MPEERRESKRGDAYEQSPTSENCRHDEVCKPLESTVIRELNRTEKESSEALAIGPELGVRLAALTQATASTDSDLAELKMKADIEAVCNVDISP